MDPATFCFVDESYINVNEGVGRFQWVLPGEPVEPRERVRWPVKILIFAAIAVGFRFLVVIVLDAKKDQKLDSRKYKLRCLSPLVPHLLSRNLTLVQDGAKPHTAKEVQKYLAGKGVQQVQNWPPRSPCLNPIEELFSVLKRGVAEDMPTTHDGLVRSVRTQFNMLSQQYIDNLSVSFRSKMQYALKTKGTMYK